MERLFDRYVRGTLSEAGRRRLRRLLEDESAARRFVGFLQEWSLIAELSLARREGNSDAPRSLMRRPS